MKVKIKGIRGSRTGYLSYAGRFLDELVFPYQCPICGELIPEDLRLRHIAEPYIGDIDAYACPDCREELDLVKEPYCTKCGKELLYGNDTGLCGDCGKKERNFIEARVLMNYDEIAREILSGLKYRGMKENACLVGGMAAERLGEWITSRGIDLLVPVPVHRERLRTRGYNQAELIARSLGQRLGIPVAQGLIRRTKKTSAQKELGENARLLNLQSAFGVDPGYLSRLTAVYKGRMPRVLVVDDIYTTGATMEAVSEALIAGGIDRIYGLFIAAGKDYLVIDRTRAL